MDEIPPARAEDRKVEKRIPLRRVLQFSLLILILLCLGLAGGVTLAIGPSLACRGAGNGPLQVGTNPRRLDSGGRERCHLLHLPPGFDPDDPLPVVFSFHGFASRPEGQEDISRWNEIADGEGFIVIYPQGTSFPLRWNTRSSSADTVDDVQFFRDIIDDLAGILTLDRDRIFVTGLSNGGAMTHRLACEVADLIAAAGTVAAPISDLPGGCQPSRPVPLIAFHGTADPIVSYNGGSVSFTSRDRDGELYPHAFGYQPAEVWVRDWAVLNGCDTTPETFSHAEDVLGARYSGCEEDAEVILYTIDGGGHTWPGGARLPRLITGETSSQIQASERMWAFFLEHSSPTTLAE